MGVIGLGVRIRGNFGDIDPLNKVPFKRDISRVWKGPLVEGVSIMLPRIWGSLTELRLEADHKCKELMGSRIPRLSS